jgi:hypothetical protein
MVYFFEGHGSDTTVLPKTSASNVREMLEKPSFEVDINPGGPQPQDVLQ